MLYKVVIIIIVCCYPIPICAEGILSFFFQPYPELFPEQFAQEFSDKLTKPGKIARQTLYRQYNDIPIAGIFSTYAGYIDVSDAHGQTQFPLMHSQFPGVTLIITTKLTPIVMAGNTIAHWELEEGTPASLFNIEKKQDQETELFYWETTSKAYPDDRKIPLTALVVIARPDDIYVPIGATLARKSPHLLLPDIYIKKGIKLVGNTLYMLNLKHFFGPITFFYQRQPKRYSQMLIK